jgi:hypothetical protein
VHGGEIGKVGANRFKVQCAVSNVGRVEAAADEDRSLARHRVTFAMGPGPCSSFATTRTLQDKQRPNPLRQFAKFSWHPSNQDLHVSECGAHPEVGCAPQFFAILPSSMSAR